MAVDGTANDNLLRVGLVDIGSGAHLVTHIISL